MLIGALAASALSRSFVALRAILAGGHHVSSEPHAVRRVWESPVPVSALAVMRNPLARGRGIPCSGVELRGFEPLTPWLQTRCSAKLSYSPGVG